MEGHPCEDIWAQQETPTCHLSPSKWSSLVTVTGHSVTLHHLPPVPHTAPPEQDSSAREVQDQQEAFRQDGTSLHPSRPCLLQPDQVLLLLGQPPLAGSSSSLHPGVTPPACEPQSPQMQMLFTLLRLNLSQ